MTAERWGEHDDRRRSEAGQITAMLVIFSICLLMVVGAVTDLSASYLRREAATSLADGAALAASDAAAATGVYGDADDGYVTFDQRAAAAAVDRYMSETGAVTDYPGLAVHVVVEGHTVTVSLSMPYTLPVSLPGVRDSTTIHGTGSAVMPIY